MWWIFGETFVFAGMLIAIILSIGAVVCSVIFVLWCIQKMLKII